MKADVYRFGRSLVFYSSMIILAFFSVYLLIMGSFVWFNGGCTAFDEMHVVLRGFCMLATVLLLFLLFGFLSAKLDKLSERKLRRIALIGGAVFFVLQMSFVMLARAGIRYDSLKVVDEAIALFSQRGILETDLDGYFARYANNYAMTIMTHWFIKIFRAVGLIRKDFSNAVIVLQFINVFFVDAAFLGCYAFLNKYFGKARAVCFLLYMACNPLCYVWLPFYYTNTCSMAFAVWGIYLLYAAFDLKNRCMDGRAGNGAESESENAVRHPENRRRWVSCIVCIVVSGALFYLGYKIRATVVIALIAGLLGQFYRGGSGRKSGFRTDERKLSESGAIKQKTDGQNGSESEESGQKPTEREEHKKYADARIQAFVTCGLILVLIISMGLTKAVYKPIEKHYLTFDANETAFPLTHWIAMGLAYYGDGSYNAGDEQNTMSYSSAEEKKDATTKLMRIRLRELGAGGVFRLYMKKLSNTFGDGAGGYHSELNISRDYGLIWQIVYGVHRDPLLFWTQSFYLMSILCTVFAILFLWKKKLPEESFALLLLLTGSYLFQMIWESATIYSIGTMYLNGCMAAFGLACPLSAVFVKSNDMQLSRLKTEENIESETKSKPNAKSESEYIEPNQPNFSLKKYNILKLCLLVAGMIGFIGMAVRLARTDYTEVSVSVDQFLFQAEEYPALSYGQEIRQTFQSEKKFSTIAFQIRNYTGEFNDSSYLVSLYDGAGTLLQQQELVGSETQDFGFCRLPFDSVDGISDYEIRIEKKSGKQDLIFLYYDTGHYDTYPNGKMTGPVVGEMADLLFEVYLSW